MRIFRSDQGRRPGAAPDPGAGRGAARARTAEERQAAVDHSRQGCCLRAGRCGYSDLIKVVDPAPRQIPAPDAVQRALELLKSAKRPLIILGKGAAYAQADADIQI